MFRGVFVSVEPCTVPELEPTIRLRLTSSSAKESRRLAGADERAHGAFGTVVRANARLQRSAQKCLLTLRLTSGRHLPHASVATARRAGDSAAGCTRIPGRHTGDGARKRREFGKFPQEKWWRRRESNPRPKARPRGTLHACPLLISRARREEAAKNRRAPDPVNLAATRRAAA